jgi:hypothetical protein
VPDPLYSQAQYVSTVSPWVFCSPLVSELSMRDTSEASATEGGVGYGPGEWVPPEGWRPFKGIGGPEASCSIALRTTT